MEVKTGQSRKDQRDVVRETYDEVQSDGRYEEGMARMAVYHHHCQDPVIFRTLGNVTMDVAVAAVVDRDGQAEG